MAQSIDELQIEINAQAGKANDAIDRLINRIDKLTTSIGHLDGSNLVSLANGVQRLGTAMQTMNNVKTADFSRLARNLQNLNNIDVSKLSNLSANVRHIATAFNGLSGMDKSAEQISLLANGIKQLGYKSADKAIANIPQLATAMKKLMKELSTAPKVSQNLIDMTNALAKLARTGSSSGKAANSLVSSFNRISKASSGMKINLLSAVNGISAIRKSILQAMGIAGGFYAVFQGIKESINIASDLTEVQNVVDVTFGDFKSKIEDLAKVSIPELGMSELTVKQIGSRFQAMGVAMGISQKGMADMSTELTRLAGDMASFYNVEQKAVGEDLESIFTGQTKPLRQYGLDLTEATLQEWAMKQGMDANINSMSQMEKTMLRYQYVMANTGAAHGDFLRTQDTWANQVRILKENFRELASVIGSSFINALKPLVSALNNAMSHIIAFAKVVSNALGKIFGWKYEDTSGGIANDYSEAADSVGDLADGTGKAANNAKKLKQQLQGIDELNVLSSNKDTGTGGGSGGGGGASGGADDSGGQWVKTDSILKDYESQLDTLYKLGEHIGETLTNTMKSIDWDNVYQGAKNFGSGLASFLNGLISPELFGEVGKTIAGSLNTALYALNSFGKTFDWKDFGNSIASGINNFFSTFDFKNLADTINTWVDGIKTTIVTTIKNIKWSDIIKGAFDFIGELELDTIAIAIGGFAWFHGGKEIVKGTLSSLLSKQISIGIGETTIPISKAIGLTITTAVVGFKIGNDLYDHIPAVQEATDSLVELVGGVFTGEIKLEELFKASVDFELDIFAKTLNLLNKDGKPITGDDISASVKNLLTDVATIPLKIITSITGSDLVQWVLGKIKAGKDLAESILFSLSNGSSGGLISWILEKIKDKKEISKSITGIITNGSKSNLVTWILGKIRDGKIVSKSIIGNIVNGGKNNVASWLVTKIYKGYNITKGISIGLFWSSTANKVIKWLFEKAYNGLSIGVNLLTSATRKENGGVYYNNSWHNIAQYANGGLPSHGTIFAAGEAGPEVVGHVGGRTEVLNQSQLASTMYSAVLSAMNDSNKNNQPIQVYLDGKVVFDSTRQYAREYTNRTGKPAYI